MGIFGWFQSKDAPKDDAKSHFKQSLDDFDAKRLSGAISSDDESSVYEEAVERQEPYVGKPLRKIDYSSEQYGGFNTASGHNQVDKMIGDQVLSRKEFLRDAQSGAAISVDENVLRTRTNFTQKDEDGDDRQIQRETKVGRFKKKVAYRVNVEERDGTEEKSLEKEITRGGRAASLTWTKKADGSRDFNGFTLGPVSFRSKQTDGTKHLKIQVGKGLGYERFKDKDNQISKRIMLGKSYSRSELIKDGNRIESRTWKLGNTKVSSVGEDGSVAKYKQKGINSEKLSMDQIESAIDKKNPNLKVRRLGKIGADGLTDRDFEKSKYSLRKRDYKRGTDGANNLTIKRNRLGIQTRDNKPGEETLLAQKMLKTPGSFPNEKAITPGDDSQFKAKLMKLQDAHKHDRNRDAIRLR